MKLFDESGLVCDLNHNQWECRWQRLEGYPMPHTTHVHLRPVGADADTHYVVAQWSPDIFQLDLIDGKFVPLKL